jgi:tRNA threonylcarbamoyl adenosine modification protein (Sua5/YciO/YrdC/YwlC family)
LIGFDAALARLAAERVVAAATESFFGLLADATEPRAVDTLLGLKPRGADKGVPLLVPSLEAWSGLVNDVPEAARRLAAHCWPGALTIALRAAPGVDPRLTLDGSVAVRVAGPSPAADLAFRFGRPLTATSANLPGAAPAVDAEMVLQVFASAIEDGRLSVLAGKSAGGLPSTVVRIEPNGDWSILREGRVGRADVEAALLSARSE